MKTYINWFNKYPILINNEPFCAILFEVGNGRVADRDCFIYSHEIFEDALQVYHRGKQFTQETGIHWSSPDFVSILLDLFTK